MDLNIEKIIRSNQDSIEPIVGKYLKNKKVLDVGCGNGLNACYFKKRYNSDVTLVDREDIRTEEALGFSFVKTSLEKMPFTKKQFDVVFLQYVIHHISPEISIDDVFAELKRISNLIIIVEEIQNEKTNLEKALKFDLEINKLIHPEVDMPIYKYYSDQKLKDCFRKFNLEIIKEKIVNHGSEENGNLQNKAYILNANK